ncbi:Connector enhancer of kinase suppressor of ras 2 [Schistosoma japonicum]|uniref:Connector enhancer of kinase suppressor of ras 2 n=2 Tax=Schistosoma japonicum TaxID=6182 RepID=A0A4Z2DA01_SCHJA|nr:Connector enhancer of kinase suppressor of ras 2 [Schistosoma japonicum]
MDGFEKPQSYVSWTTAQVISWLSGLDDALEPYLPTFIAKNISGKWLSCLTADVLGKYGVQKVGHQMIIMEKVKQLQYQFSSFDNETLQSVLLRVSRACTCIVTAINSLMAITKRQDADSPYPGILSDIQEAVTYILGCILNLMSTIGSAASWLERPPFSLLPDMTVFRQFLVENAIITNRLSQQAISTQCNQHFREIIDYIEPMRSRVEDVLQNCSDSIILTPCGIETVQIRKLDSADFGFNFRSTINNIHVIVSVQNESPAFSTGKVSKGDEVIEVNEQIVIGWLHYRVADLMRHSSQHISLRLRKRPCHSNDFIGFPGAGRRHRLVVNQIPPAGSLSQIRGAYIFARNPKRRLPLTGPLSAEPLAVTQEITSDQTSVSSPTSTSAKCQSTVSVSGLFYSSPTSSLSVQQGTSIKINDDSCNLENFAHISSKPIPTNESVIYSNSRLIASTPNTPLMTLRSVDGACSHSSLSSSRHLPPAYPGTMTFDNGINDPNVISSDVAYSKKYKSVVTSHHIRSTSCSSNKSVLPRFSQTHRRTASGDPKLLDNMCSRNCEDASSQNTTNPSSLYPYSSSSKFHALDKRYRNLHRSSLDDFVFFLKHGLGSKKPTRRISCKDLGQGDCQGWLWLKKTNALTSKYVKRWCVYKNSTFYYYRNPEDESAEGLILLHGFTITPAVSVKSGKFAFSVFNDWVRFVFASDSELDRSKWMNKLGLASIGLSSTIPTSRIGGFNPGYMVSHNSRNNEIKSEAPLQYSSTMSDLTTWSFQSNNPSGTRSQTSSISRATDVAGNSITDMISQPATLPRHVSSHSVSSSSFSICNLRSNSLPFEPHTGHSVIPPANSALPPSAEHSLSPTSTRIKRRQPLGISSKAFECYSESEDEVDDEVDAECSASDNVDDNCASESAQLNLQNQLKSASPLRGRRPIILNSVEGNGYLQCKKLIPCESEARVSVVHVSTSSLHPLRSAHIAKNLSRSEKLLNIEKIIGVKHNESVPEFNSKGPNK